jgi:hypothetical protein
MGQELMRRMRRTRRLGRREIGRIFPGRRRRTLLLRVLSAENGSEEVKTRMAIGGALSKRGSRTVW